MLESSYTNCMCTGPLMGELNLTVYIYLSAGYIYLSAGYAGSSHLGRRLSRTWRG